MKGIPLNEAPMSDVPTLSGKDRSSYSAWK